MAHSKIHIVIFENHYLKSFKIIGLYRDYDKANEKANEIVKDYVNNHGYKQKSTYCGQFKLERSPYKITVYIASKPVL